MSRVLVTGASGFIGRHALAALRAAGHDVHAVARTAGAPMTGVVWHRADLLAGSDVVAEVEPEVLVHLAWYAEHGRFWTSLENVRWVEASLALLRAFADAGGRRAVLAGTCAEYQFTREIYAEDAPLAPTTLYGAAKHGLHVVASAFAEQAGVSLAWARVFFLYGPYESPGRFVASTVLALLRGEEAPMSEGTQVRDFLHAADVGGAFAALAGSEVTGAVNIGSGAGLQLREVGREIARQIGREELLRVGARPAPPGEPEWLVADVSRLCEEVGWRPRIELGDGVRQVIEHWRERLATEQRELEHG